MATIAPPGGHRRYCFLFGPIADALGLVLAYIAGKEQSLNF